jgi:hypothetical protein
MSSNLDGLKGMGLVRVVREERGVIYCSKIYRENERKGKASKERERKTKRRKNI